jgi:uncharacterized protein
MAKQPSDQLSPQLNIDPNQYALRFEAYHAGCIRINKTAYDTALVILCDRIIETDSTPYTELTRRDILRWHTEHNPDLILIGCAHHNSYTLYDDIQNHHQHIGVEIMSTVACIHAYIAMQVEQRRVLCYLSAA